MSREQVEAARQFARVLADIVPLLTIRREWEIRFRMSPGKSPTLKIKFVFAYGDRAYTVENAISLQRHYEPAEIQHMAEHMLATADSKFVAAVAAYDQENSGLDLTPDDE